MAKNLTHLPKIQYLSEAVTSILGCNPSSLHLLGTNSYLVGKGKDRLLIDTSNDDFPEYISNLKSVLQSSRSTIKSMLITHHHLDHIGAVTNIREMLQSNIPIYKMQHSEVEHPNLENLHYIKDNHKFEIEGATLQVVYNPGHTADHFVVLFEEENAIFSGDSVLGEGTTTFNKLSDYMTSLQALKSMKPKILYPGHGPVIRDPDVVLTYYIKHRLDREAQILQVLHKFGPQTAQAIVEILYKDYPRTVFGAATRGVGLHLDKLLEEGSVHTTQSDGVNVWLAV